MPRSTGGDTDESELAVQFGEYTGCWRYIGESDAGSLAREMGKLRLPADTSRPS